MYLGNRRLIIPMFKPPAVVSAGFNPIDLFGGGEDGVFYDISDLTTLFEERTGASATTASSVDGVVGTVLDKSGNAHHLTAADDAERPILRQSGSLYYLEFDGSDDELSNSSLSITQAMVMGLAAAIDSSDGGADRLFDSDDSARMVFGKQNSTKLLYGGSPFLQPTDSFPTGDHVWTFIADGSSSSFREDGGSDLASGDIGTNGFTGLTLGSAFSGAENLDGKIYAFVALDRLFTGNERADLETWLGGKIGISI